MPDPVDLDGVLAGARVDADVFALRPDYDAFLIEAESAAREELGRNAVEDLPHLAAWRDAYRAFGAKPQRTRPSVEALLRRTSSGLPRINRLTDVYNAVSEATSVLRRG